MSGEVVIRIQALIGEERVVGAATPRQVDQQALRTGVLGPREHVCGIVPGATLDAVARPAVREAQSRSWLIGVVQEPARHHDLPTCPPLPQRNGARGHVDRNHGALGAVDHAKPMLVAALEPHIVTHRDRLAEVVDAVRRDLTGLHPHLVRQRIESVDVGPDL